MRAKAILVTIGIFLILGFAVYIKHISAPQQDNVVWVWDGSNPPASAKNVALVVEHLWLKDSMLLHRSRKTSPALISNVRVTPVVHVEVDVLNPPTVPDQYRQEIISAVLGAAAVSTSGWVQLDYEAPPSHKILYKNIVHEIKRRLPYNIKLSVTTLAWWCSAGNWLDDLDADEVVPMFFKMGKDTMKFNQILRDYPQSLSPVCQNQSAGFALQERPSPDVIQRYSKVYWFDYEEWKGKSTWPLG